MRTDPKTAILTVALAAAAFTLPVAQAADIRVLNVDEPGIGFNDLTPQAPVGGNAGVTLGEQRKIIFQFVADFWGKKLNSSVPIQVLSSFAPLSCTATSATLGSAGAYNIYSDFPNAKRTGAWYPSALATKLAGVPLAAGTDPMVSADIVAFFNGNLGAPDCLAGTSFYLGLDGKAAANQIDLVTTVLHEFGHGLGFQTFTDDVTGRFVDATDENPAGGKPSIWDFYLRDPAQNKTWDRMTNEERVRSAITPRNLVWNGPVVTKAVPGVLKRGVPELFAAGRGLNKLYTIGTAQFGPAIEGREFIVNPLRVLVDQADGKGLACTPLSAANAAAVAGKVAIIDRGSCAFTVKVKNAQLAGARAVIIADNAPGAPAANLSGTDSSIAIPAVRVTQADGAELKSNVLAARRPGAYGVLFANQLKINGADYFNRAYLYTPDPVRPGSSVSHYDVSSTPNLLMEPFAEPEQPIAVNAPKDLTLELLNDIGW